MITFFVALEYFEEVGGKPGEEDPWDPGVLGREHDPGEDPLPVPDELHGPLPHQLHHGPGVVPDQAVNTRLGRMIQRSDDNDTCMYYDIESTS